MKNKGFHRPAAVTHWLGAIAAQGCVLSHRPAIIHHPIGESGKHNKLPIGMWWVIPLDPDMHDLLHRNFLQFAENEIMPYDRRVDWEKDYFAIVCARYDRDHDERPFGHDIYQAIMDYHR